MTPRIVLYNPRTEHWTMPLALLAVASSLDRRRFQPVVIDGRIETDPVASLLDQCDGALCLGCTVLSGAPIIDALAMSRAVKARCADLPVIWGGWHPSILPESCLEEPAVDMVVRGQGEVVLGEIAEALARGTSPVDCAGCVDRDSAGNARGRAPGPLVDLEKLPPLDYSLIDVEAYFRRKAKRQIDYFSSLGCPFRCSFCADPSVYRRQWTGLGPERIGDDLQRLWQRWRFDDVNFQDETFFNGTDRVVGVASQLLDRDLDFTWAATLRADQGARLPEEVFGLCARSGLRRVNIGVEAATQAGLDTLRKDITLDQVRISAERCARHGIAASFSFIVGFPGEPASDVSSALDLAAELRTMSRDFRTPFFFYQPYPGADLGSVVWTDRDHASLSLEEWATFDFVGTAGAWVPDDVRLRVEPFTLERGSC